MSLLRRNNTLNLLLSRFAATGTETRFAQINTQIQQALRNANQAPSVTAGSRVSGLVGGPAPAADLLNPQTLVNQLARTSVFPSPPQGVARGESYSTTQSEGRTMSAPVSGTEFGIRQDLRSDLMAGLIGAVQKAGTAYQTFPNTAAQVRAPQFPVPALAARPALVQRLLQQRLSRVR